MWTEMYIVEDGTVREEFETLAEAQERSEDIMSRDVMSLPCVFLRTEDGHERLVRDDGTSVAEWHRDPQGKTVVDDAALLP